jgi:glycosyltransferase involved in cell wall biosynthesis
MFIGPIFEKLVLKTRCDAFHTISDASKEDLIKFGAKKPIYNIPPTIEEIQESHMIQNNNQFIYVGRLVFYKNVEILVKAINIVKNQENKIKLVIVGGGPQLEMIQEMVRNMNLEENITIKGYVTSEEKIKIISQSNAMLFPSKCEGFGLVILESWQQNRPVIASDIPPMSDIIQHEKTGLIVDPNDEKKWAEKIIQLIKNPSISDEMGKKGNKVLHEKYNQEIFYQKLISMYQSVL